MAENTTGVINPHGNSRKKARVRRILNLKYPKGFMIADGRVSDNPKNSKSFYEDRLRKDLGIAIFFNPEAFDRYIGATIYHARVHDLNKRPVHYAPKDYGNGLYEDGFTNVKPGRSMYGKKTRNAGRVARAVIEMENQ